MICSFCSSPKVLEVMKLVNIVILIIRIAVPIILILSVMIKYLRAVYDKDADELSKVSKAAINNAIAAIIIFLIPTFVSAIVGLFGAGTDYKECLKIYSTTELRQKFSSEAENLVRKAEQTLTIEDYTIAYNYLTNVNDKEKEKELRQRLEKVKAKIDNKGSKDNEDSKSSQAKHTVVSDYIHLGDSRIEDYANMKSYLGIDTTKESIFSKESTGYDNKFKSQMQSAYRLMESNPNKTYAVIVNYGVNAKGSYEKFCDYYDDFIKSMDKKHHFYIVSVNPFNERNVKYYKNSNTNANLEIFNNYMKNTCISKIKANSPDAQIYYCDVYGSISLSDWVNKGYITGDGIHYTKAGSKYIYDTTMNCVASHQ